LRAAWLLKLLGSLAIGAASAALLRSSDLPLPAIAAFCLLLVAGSSYNSFAAYRQAALQFGSLARANVVKAASLALIMGVLAYQGSATALTMLLGLVVSEVVGALLLAPVASLTGRVSKEILVAVLRPAVVIGLGVICTALYSRVYTLGLARYGTETDLGLFGAASRLIDAFQLLPAILTMVIFPIVCATESDDLSTATGVVGRATAFSGVLGMALCTVVSLTGGTILHIVFASRYEPAEATLLLLANMVPILFANPVLTAALYAQGRGRTVMWITVANLVTAVILVALLLPRFGLLGAAASWIVVEAQNGLLHAGRLRGFLPRRTVLTVVVLALLPLSVVASVLLGSPVFGRTAAVLWMVCGCAVVSLEWTRWREWIAMAADVTAAARRIRREALTSHA
jgi:O-antigen/teichoic acid export membrane protein